MTLFDGIILGIVEGLAEFLPISSTGHLILAAEFLRIPQSEFLKSFDISIQLGAILAVVILYFRSFLNIEILKRIAIAFVPTGIIGFTLYPFVRESLIGNELVVIWALFLGGIALIAFELLHREKEDAVDSMGSITYKQSLLIGMFQALAIVPGVSRSAATIVGGLVIGLRRATIVEFSFLLAAPTMVAATGYDLLKTAASFSAEEFTILGAGFLSAFVVAILAMKFLLAFVRTRSFIPFGIYRIVVAMVFFLFIFQ